MKKHICLVLFNIPLDQTSGSCTYVIGLSKYLYEKGFNVTIICNKLEKNNLEIRLLKEQINIIELYTERLYSRTKTFCYTQKDKLSYVLKQYINCIDYLLKIHKIDLFIFQHLACSNILSRYIKLNYNINNFAVAHGTDLYELKNSNNFNEIFSNIDIFDKIICPSILVFNNLLQLFGEKIKHNLIISSPGINNVFFDNDNLEFIDRKDILYIGRLIPEKGVIDCIEIFKIIYKKDRSIKLKIIGEGNLFNFIKTTYKDYIELGVIELLGEKTQKEIGNFLRKCRLFLYTANWEEPFGMVLIEAMACGVPIVARNVGIIEQILGVDYKYRGTSNDVLTKLVDNLYNDKNEWGECRNYLLGRSKNYKWSNCNINLLNEIIKCI